jgi:hypothetical protein
LATPKRNKYKTMIKLNDKLICNNAKPLTGNDVAPPLKEGEEYTASLLHSCGCGKVHIGVGLYMEVNYVRCYDCKEELPTITHWCHPSRFTNKTNTTNEN